MEDKRVLEVGTASVENIKKCVGVLKASIKMGKEPKPTVSLYLKGSELYVGLYGNTNSKRATTLKEESVVVNFTEQDYIGLAQSTEDVVKMSKMIQANAQIKVEKGSAKAEMGGRDRLLTSVEEFLDNGNKVNIVYDKGVAGYVKTDNKPTKSLLEDINHTITSGKTIKGVQVMGIKQVTLYLKVKGNGNVEISFTYLGTKDNVYETIKWDGKKSIKDVVYNKLKESREYDRGLKKSHLDKEGV